MLAQHHFESKTTNADLHIEKKREISEESIRNKLLAYSNKYPDEIKPEIKNRLTEKLDLGLSTQWLVGKYLNEEKTEKIEVLKKTLNFHLKPPCENSDCIEFTKEALALWDEKTGLEFNIHFLIKRFIEKVDFYQSFENNSSLSEDKKSEKLVHHPLKMVFSIAPIVNLDQLKQLFQLLKENGMHSGIINYNRQSHGFYHHELYIPFSDKSIKTNNTNELAEKFFNLNSLKPDSYIAIGIKIYLPEKVPSKTLSSYRILKEFKCIDRPSEDKSTGLHVAIRIGCIDSTQYWLDNNYNPDSKTEQGWAPAHIAVDYGNTLALDTLIKHNAKVNIVGNDNSTPLFWGVYHGRIDCVKLLLASQANPNIKDNNNRSPLYIAVLQKKLEICNLLLKAKADVNESTPGNSSLLHLAAKEKENVDIVKALLQSGAKVDKTNSLGETALLHSSIFGNSLIADAIIAHAKKADLDIARFEDNTTSLIAAVSNNHFDIAKLLLKAGADPNLENKKGESAFEIAVYKGDLGLINLFLDNNAKSNKKLFIKINSREVNSLFIKNGLKPPILKPDFSQNHLNSQLVYFAKKYKNKTITDEMIDIYEKGQGMCSGYAVGKIIGSIIDRDSKHPSHCIDLKADLKENSSKNSLNSFIFNLMLLTVSIWDSRSELTNNEIWLFTTLFQQVYRYQTWDCRPFALGKVIENGMEIIPPDFTLSGCFNQETLSSFLHAYPEFLNNHTYITAEHHATTFIENSYYDSNNKNGVIKCNDYKEAANNVFESHSLKSETFSPISFHVFIGRNEPNPFQNISVEKVLANYDPGDKVSNDTLALHFAIRNICERSFIYWLNKTSNINTTNSDGHTPLVLAAHYNRLRFVKALLEKKANPNIYTKYSPLELATEHSNHEMIKLLLDNGANPNGDDYLGFTALINAVRNKDLLSVEILLKAGMNPNISRLNGVIALHTAVVLDNADITAALIKAGSYIHASTKSGLTALMLASNYGHVKCLKKLLAYGADLFQEDIQGNTALSFATNPEIKYLLIMCIELQKIIGTHVQDNMKVFYFFPSTIPAAKQLRLVITDEAPEESLVQYNEIIRKNNTLSLVYNLYQKQLLKRDDSELRITSCACTLDVTNALKLPSSSVKITV